MRKETRKRLDRLQSSEWRGWLPALAVLALFVGGAVAMRMGAGDSQRIAGVVESADWRLNQDTGQHYPHIEVKLDTGASVRVGSLATSLPAVGARISIRQRPLLFDYLTTYEWDGPGAPPAPPPVTPSPTPVSLP
jgi:hypothetical protein